MDAIAYQMSFDEGQLALLCANYDRRIDSLDAENKQLQAENAKLRELVRHLRECTRHNVCAVCEYADDACDFDHDLRELGVVK